MIIGDAAWSNPPTIGVPVTSELRRWCEARRRDGSARFNAETSATLRRTLRLVREHLDMDVAWLAHIGRPTTPATSTSIQLVDGDSVLFTIREGPADAALARFVERFLSGELPAVVGDAAEFDPDVAENLHIGAYAAVAVAGPDTRPYGLLAAFSSRPHPGLRHRDADALRLFAEMQTETIAAYEGRHALAETFLRNAEAMLDAGGVRTALQPILDLSLGRPMAQEALSRFPTDAYTTQEWFTEAWKAGCGLELEMDAVSSALQLLPTIAKAQRLSINASPALMTSGRLEAILAGQPLHRLIIEITEHNLAESIDALNDQVADLQRRGAWIAIDDAGTGYSSLSQILQLGPDIIKLDRTLVTEVDTDPMKRALANAFVTFTSQAKVGLVAEGVETEAELRTLEELGVPFAQGYYLARPTLARPTLARPPAGR
jgi:EAL domain-containing protein (putative c-di-GMP-specific phosphodiesterase class I)